MTRWKWPVAVSLVLVLVGAVGLFWTNRPDPAAVTMASFAGRQSIRLQTRSECSYFVSFMHGGEDPHMRDMIVWTDDAAFQFDPESLGRLYRLADANDLNRNLAKRRELKSVLEIRHVSPVQMAQVGAILNSHKLFETVDAPPRVADGIQSHLMWVTGGQAYESISDAGGDSAKAAIHAAVLQEAYPVDAAGN